MARFDTNRAAIREALTRLELDGLVQRTPNRGAAVPDLQPAEVERLYDVRVCIETAAIERLRFPLAKPVIDRLIEIQSTEAVEALDRRRSFKPTMRFTARSTSSVRTNTFSRRLNGWRTAPFSCASIRTSRPISSKRFARNIGR